MCVTEQLQPGPELDERIAMLLGWKRASLKNTNWISPQHNVCGYIPKFSRHDPHAIIALQQLCKPVEEGGRDWEYMDCYQNKVWGMEVFTLKNWYGPVESKISFAHAASLAMLAALEAEK